VSCQYWFRRKFSESGFTKLFLYMKNSKKSVAGHVEVWTLFGGESKAENKDLSVKTVEYCLRAMIQINESKIVLFGLKNGF
jgi:hypothetical protein